MKNLILIIAILISSSSFGQPSIVTIKKNGYMPSNQLFRVKGKKYDNLTYFYTNSEYAVDYLNHILEEYDITFEDGVLRDDGCLVFDLDQGNGFACYVVVEPMELDALISFYVYPYFEGYEYEE